ncbi:F-box protein CPR1-like [Papaver somniferum]|uniref:F-box protein CPR1-like n=1 Tax=Papaver somniferum TaxID=3469 RepID=UPI000E704BDF|nr:F-box protein CPR1-like [Papaver somniferum]
MSSLPRELYYDIFLRLPMKSLLACKYVCETWFELISDPSFIESHLNLAAQANNPRLIFTSYHMKRGHVICSISDQLSLSATRTEHLHDNSVELDYQFNSLQYFPLLGSCNGLVCLLLDSATSYESVCIWNPATTEYKIIPDPPGKHIAQPITHWAFGYDYKADDYMLLCCSSLSMAVYTLKSNSWNTIRTPYELMYGLFVNGIPHWLVETQGRHFCKAIISLDISYQKFVELQLPNEPLEHNHLFVNLGVLEGCLGVLVNVIGVCWEVWVMQSYGVRKSWTKRCLIAQNRIFCDSSLSLVWSLKNGDILLRARSYKTFFLYDTVHGIARELKHMRQVYDIENYIESLVSLNSGTYAKERANIIGKETRKRSRSR